MPRELDYSPLALDDLARMRRWQNQPGSGTRGKEKARKVTVAAKELKADPVRWPAGKFPGTRERAVEGYTIVYEVTPDTNDRRTAGDVFILRVYGPGQERP
jgi:hypothetical protein